MTGGGRVVLVAPDTWRALQSWAEHLGVRLVRVTAAAGQLPRYQMTGTPPRRNRASAQLTERELQMLGYAAQGLTNPEIGARLYLTEDTVKTHMARMFRKIGARNRAHAVDIGHRCGLLSGGAARLETQELARVLTEHLGRHGSDRILAELGRAS